MRARTQDDSGTSRDSGGAAGMDGNACVVTILAAQD